MVNSNLSWRSVMVAILVVMMAPTMASSRSARNQDKMAKEPALVCRLLASSISIAHKTGQIINDVFQRTDFSNMTEGLIKFQTEADKSVLQCIAASFKNLYPKVTILGEEIRIIRQQINVPKDWLITDLDPKILELKCPKTYNNVTEDQVTLWIDPLDGVPGIAKGHSDHVTVLIGISVNSDPVAGVIYQPFWEKRGRTVWGLVGRGFGGLVLKEPPSNELVYVTSNNHFTKRIEIILSHLKPCKLIKTDGAGNKVLYLLEGKAHAYIYPRMGLMRWDTAAPEAILRAAGGELTDTLGRKYNYSRADAEYYPFNRYGVFANAPSFIRTKLQKRINEIIEEGKKMNGTLLYSTVN